MSKNLSTLLQAGRKLVFSPDMRSDVFVSKKEWSFLPTKRALRRFRGGSFIGRLGRHFFEHKLINRVLGSQLALAAVVTSVFQVVPSSSLSILNAQSVNLNAEKISLVTSRGVQYPLTKIKINQGYKFYHPGIDFDGDTGDPVKPVMPGRVSTAGYSRLGYGNSVVLDHGNGITSLYAHLSKIEVKSGQEVEMSTEIGKVGSTGHSTGSHLHLEIRENDKPVNPLSILPR